MRIDRVTFTGSAGQQLVGRLHLPAQDARAFILFAHCFTCGKDLKIAARMADAWTQEGFGVLRFDFTGLGESGGDFADSTFSSNVDDIVAAADALAAQHRAPQLLVGHSLGGAAVIAAAGRLPDCTAVATIGAPAEARHIRRLIDAETPELAERGEATVRVGGRPFRIKQALIDDLEAQQDAQQIGSLGRALLILHSPQDLIVGIEQAEVIYRAARHPKSFISLDGADHLLSDPRDAQYAASAIAAWARRYLDAAAPTPVDGGAPREGIVVASTSGSGLAVDLHTQTHTLRADEPTSLGGTATGPTPYDLLLAGLGACTAMTLRLYANRKQIPLSGVRVELEHERVHAQDCEDCESTEGRVAILKRRLTLDGPLNGEQRQRLQEIADRCPVHRTLTHEIIIRTELVDDPQQG